jgi:hypothetical protein
MEVSWGDFFLLLLILLMFTYSFWNSIFTD